jgi:hypothetical protein
MGRVLVGHVLGDADEVEQGITRARLAHVAPQRLQPAQLALDDDDGLALGRLQELPRVLALVRPRQRMLRHGHARLGALDLLGRRRRHDRPLLLGNDARQERRHGARLVDAPLLRPELEEEGAERAVEVTRRLITIVGLTL